MPIAITEAITTLAVAEQRFNLQRTEAPDFFPEWQTHLPDLTNDELRELAILQQRYRYQRSQGQLLEGTILLLLASPLLALGGFYDPPFQVRAEESVRLTLTDSEETLQGRLDIVVILDQLWIVVVESKKTALSVWSALPQTLAYLQAAPQSPSFGLMTNGDEFVFVKVAEQARREYDLSRVFALFSTPRDLQDVLRVLKGLGQCLVNNPSG
jgi:hypothetical protein